MARRAKPSRRATRAKPSRRAKLRASRLKFELAENTAAITHLDAPTRFRRRNRIHPRKIIPALPFGEIVGDSTPDPAVAVHDQSALAGAAAATPIQVLQNVQLNGLAAADTASHVCEPSVALNGDVVFLTGNWFASLSTDGGRTFQYVNPYTAFADPPGSGFCCDQIVIFSPQHDHFFWLLQYEANKSGENVQRIAYATTQDVAIGNWQFFDISSASLGLKGSWLDFPDLALTNTKLYLTTNAFKGKPFSGTAIVRIAIDKLLNGEIAAEKIVDTDIFNFRVAQNCEDTAFWGTHITNSRMRIYQWNDSDAAPTSFEVDVPTWTDSTDDQPYVSLTPDGQNWLERVDSRIVAAARSGNELWFGWTAGPGGVNARPNPYVQIARIDATTRQLVDSVNLWDPQDAACCPAFGTDANGDVGVSYCIGGPARFPTHVIGYVTGNPTHVTTFAGQRSPNDRKWGDYLAVRRCYPQTDRLIATGYTLQAAVGNGNNDSIPNITIFGR